MIPTLTTGLFLYKVNRYRAAFEIRMAGQRKAYILICMIMTAITAVTILTIVYHG